MDENTFYGYGFFDGSGTYLANLADSKAFQSSEYAIVIKEEKEQEVEAEWDKDTFFGKKR